MQRKKSPDRLTLKILEVLKEHGYQYVLVTSYTIARATDYMEMNDFLLTPVRELPVKRGEMEIFEPIDSDILRDWADYPDSGVKAFVEVRERSWGAC